MIIKWLLFLVALTAHYWLWGRWSLEETQRDTLLLVLTTVLLFVYLVVPLRTLLKKQSPAQVFNKWWMSGIFYLYIVLIIILSLFHLTGLIKILLPIKIALLGAYAYIKYKLKPQK